MQWREGSLDADTDAQRAATGPAGVARHREVHRVRAIAGAGRSARPDGRQGAAPRRARQALDPWLGPLVRVGWLWLEVRPHGHRAAQGSGRAQIARHGGLPQAAALSSGQPDHQHSPHQGCAQRGRPGVHRAGRPRCRPGIPGRRRRAGHRLRRHQLHQQRERQLLATRVRQRRDLHDRRGVP